MDFQQEFLWLVLLQECNGGFMIHSRLHVVSKQQEENEDYAFIICCDEIPSQLNLYLK